MAVKRFGVSLPENLADSLDAFVSENGFANRSQALAFLIEKNIAETKWQCNHLVAGSIILMYDQEKKEINTKIEEIERAHQDLILSSSKYYLNHNFCLHTTMVVGTAKKLTALSDKMVTIKGIKHGKLVMSRAD